MLMDQGKAPPRSLQNEAGRDIVALGVAAAAILMFVGTGSAVLPQIVQQWAGTGTGPSLLLSNALLLNIALILFGSRRYRDLLRELNHQRLAEKKAQRLAGTDTLTNCLNRRSIAPATDNLIKQAKQDSKYAVLMIIDLDNFKQVNDFNGHQIGDHILKTTAERISALLPQGSLLARLGGDEFACVISFEEDAREHVDQLTERLINAVSQPTKLNGQEIRTTISVGIASNLPTAEGRQAEDDTQCMMHHADIAMYHAKKQGKNCHSWYEPSMENELRFQGELKESIRKGVREGEFLPYYEQQIDLDTGRLVGFEMLARWHSPTMGIVKPDLFIPVAEEMGIISVLSEQLIEQALIDAAMWGPQITLSVNVSPVQLRDPWFSQKLLKLLVKHNFPAQRLEVEITETSQHENLHLVGSMITSLRNLGIRISLDNFGSRNSSLAQLKALPIDRFKIDRNFVGEVMRDSGDSGAKIISAIIALGDGLSLPITAEGIEDEETLQMLRKMGSLKGQGRRFGQPETAIQVYERLSHLDLLAVTSGPPAPAGYLEVKPQGSAAKKSNLG